MVLGLIARGAAGAAGLSGAAVYGTVSQHQRALRDGPNTIQLVEPEGERPNGAIRVGSSGRTGGRHRIAQCSDIEPPRAAFFPFWFKWLIHGRDVRSVRRGFEVYRKVCSNCHSMIMLSFRHLINEVYPERRVKEIAAQYEVIDGPNDEGEMFVRPGEITDSFPRPYPNYDAARYANNGAFPPDLSVISAGRHGNADYIFSLLALGYRDPPEGFHLGQGLHYNVYMHGGAIAMPQPLTDGMIQYEDGTPATVSQMAKDVSEWLVWAAEPTFDHRKLMHIKFGMATGLGALCVGYWYRNMWMQFRSRRIDFVKPIF